MSAPIVVTHRRYRDADEARRRYGDLAGRSPVRAQDVTLGARVEAATECENPSCRTHDHRPQAFRTEINGVDRCARCKTEWTFIERGSLGVSIRSSSEGVARRMHAGMAERVLLARVLFVRPGDKPNATWEAWHAAWTLALYGGRDSRLTAGAMRIIAAAGLGTSERTLRTLAREVREEVESRLSVRGLLEGAL